MRKLLLLLLCAQPLYLPAQQAYELNAQAPALKNGDKVYLIYAVEAEQKTDSVFVQNGRFSFRGNLTYPVSALLCVHKNPYVQRLAAGEQIDYFRLYLEPAAIALISADSLKNSQISGSPVNVQNAELRAMMKPNDDTFAALNKEYDALPPDQQKDEKVHAGFVAREQQLLQESYLVHLAFVKKHPDSYISLISLSYIAGQPGMSQRAGEAYAQLTDALKNSPLGKGIPVQLHAQDNTQTGKEAPAFTLPSPDGKTISLSDFKGSYVLIDFWASWCGPCRTENPNVVKAYHQYKAKGFTVLGVSLDMPGQKAAWLKAIAQDGLSWPQVSDLKGWDNSVAKLYGVRSIPANFLLDPTGKIVARDLREDGLQKELARIFEGK